MGVIIGNTPEASLSEPWYVSQYNISLDNSFDILKAKKKLPTKMSFKSTSFLAMNQKNLNSITKEYDKLLTLSKTDKDALFLTKMFQFFAKAQTQTSPEDRFIWNWLSLNLAYNHNATTNREIGKINELGNSGFDSQDVGEIVDLCLNRKTDNEVIIKWLNINIKFLGFNNLSELLISLNLVNYDGSVNRSLELRDAIQNNEQQKVIFQKILLCLYQVRSQFMHAEPYWIKHEGINFLEVISKIIGFIVLKYIGSLARKCGL